MLSKRQMQTHKRLQEDLPFYAKNALKIRDKSGALVPFDFVPSQHYINKRLEEQRQKTGMVRAYIVKARQVRASSYTQGRFFHQSLYTAGRRTFILTHRDDATENLFNMSKTFYENLPAPLKPQMESVTGSKLIFKNGARYMLGTAASPNVGRSMNVQAFHGSEVAFWQYSDEIQTGVLQTIADVPNTEIIFESTANGPKGMFYQGVMDVLSGKDRKFIVIFIPWFWESIYQTKLPHGYRMVYDEDETHLKNTYDLTDEQLLWRRDKIVQMKALWKFKQEYPSNVIEAFQSSEESLINADAVDTARKCNVEDPNAPVIMGVDPASSGDRHPFVIRQGRHLKKIHAHEAMDGVKAAYIAIDYMRKYNVDTTFIDCTKDLSMYDNLRALGYGKNVMKVHFNERPLDDNRFVNKRAEILYGVKEWIEGDSVNIPDDDSLHAELLCIPHEEITANGKMYFISKKQIKKEYGMSPDVYDALALTFSYPVRRKIGAGVNVFRKKEFTKQSKSPISTLNRHRRSASKKKNVILFKR